MSYRPYPNADRALRQIDRHYAPPSQGRELECLRPLGEALAKLCMDSRRAVEAWPVGEYRLSTRAPVVGGGS
jgi:hypothetical protein